jgi:hypothetical protein
MISTPERDKLTATVRVDGSISTIYIFDNAVHHTPIEINGLQGRKLGLDGSNKSPYLTTTRLRIASFDNLESTLVVCL